MKPEKQKERGSIDDFVRALDNRTSKLEDDMRVLKTTVERLAAQIR